MTAERLRRLTFVCMGVCLLLFAIIAVQWMDQPGMDTGYDATSVCMDTYVQQVLYTGDSNSSAQEAAEAATGAVEETEDRLSWNRADSDIETLNSAAGTVWTEIEPETARLLRDLLDVARESGGAYDPTLLPVTSLWNFSGDPQIPKEEELQQALSLCGYENLRVDTGESTASLYAHGSGIDLTPILRGAGCDAALQSYRESGLTGGIIAIGECVGVFGHKPDGSAFSASVHDPLGDGSAVLGTWEFPQGGVITTAGWLEPSFTQAGTVCSSLLDPSTGRPADCPVLSVTVWQENGAVSAALARACMVLGVEDSLPLLRTFSACAVFVTPEKEILLYGENAGFTPTAEGYTLRQTEALSP